MGSQFVDASSARVDELERLGGGPADASASVEDYPAGADDAQNAAIAAYRDCVRLGSTTELRVDRNPVPHPGVLRAGRRFAASRARTRARAPFVTGRKDKPYVASEDDDDADESDDDEHHVDLQLDLDHSTTSTTEDGG